MPPKGMSEDDKRKMMLSLLQASGEVFNLAELEKQGAACGVRAQVIPDIVKGLVADRAVDVDKIGAGNFYWSFPSAGLLRNRAAAEAAAKAAAADSAAAAAATAAAAARAGGAADAAALAGVLAELAAVNKSNDELAKAVGALSDTDPALLEGVKAAARAAKAGADRWTDNLGLLKAWLRDKSGGRSDAEICAMIGVDAEMNPL